MKLYSNFCPRCIVLKAKLDEKGLEYETSDDMQELIDLGFKTVPVLEVDGEYMDFGKAMKWIQGM